MKSVIVSMPAREKKNLFSTLFLLHFNGTFIYLLSPLLILALAV